MRSRALTLGGILVIVGCGDDVAADGGDTGLECPEMTWEGSGEDTLTLLSAEDTGSLPLYTRIDGHLELRSMVDVTDLQFLRCLGEITGGLWVSDNPDLETLSGLENLEVVGASGSGDNFVVISGNGSLRSLEGLGSLEELGVLSIEDNPVLESMEGLSSLGRVTELSVQRNDSLSVVGLRALDTVGELRLGGLFCSEPDAMPTPDGLPGLTTIDGLDSLQSAEFVYILGNPNLESLGPFATPNMGLFGGVFQLNAMLPYADVMASGFENLYQTCGNKDDPVQCECGMMGGP